MPLKPYEQFAAEPLAFPVGGKVYTPPVISAKTGVRLMQVLAGDLSKLPAGRRSLWQMVLGCEETCDPDDAPCGGVYDQMLADGAPLEALTRAGFAMLVDWQTEDRSAAERVWESGIDPEARAALAAAARSTTLPSTPAAAAPSTPTRASGTGTRARKATPKKAATRSRGRSS